MLVVFFTCVVLHELGHSFMARRFGVKVPRILLLPVGGMAEFDSIPRKPRSEILIALAGPAVNFAIVGLLLLFVPFPGSEYVRDYHLTASTLPQFLRQLWDYWGSIELDLRGAAQILVIINLIMGCFNLIPVFPMDGGRVLRALLATRLPYLVATRVAATLGKFLASAGACYAIFFRHHPQMAALFIFIFIAGEIEYRAVRRREREVEYWRDAVKRIYGTPPAPDSLLES
jgi:Zn-dependent protease